MAMKALHSEDNADKNITGSTRQHIISRLHKAVQSAKEVVTLLSDSASGASETDVLEAKAYVYALAGAQEFEKQAEGIKAKGASPQRWDACLTNFAAARVLYSALYKATKKDLFKDVLTGTIDPSIRYAAYQNRIPRTVGVPAVAKKYFPNKDAELVKAVQSIDSSALQEEEATASSMFLSNSEEALLTHFRHPDHLARPNRQHRRCSHRPGISLHRSRFQQPRPVQRLVLSQRPCQRIRRHSHRKSGRRRRYT